MGGETSAIQRVAGKISDDIFSVFKWDRAARVAKRYIPRKPIQVMLYFSTQTLMKRKWSISIQI